MQLMQKRLPLPIDAASQLIRNTKMHMVHHISTNTRLTSVDRCPYVSAVTVLLIHAVITQVWGNSASRTKTDLSTLLQMTTREKKQSPGKNKCTAPGASSLWPNPPRHALGQNSTGSHNFSTGKSTQPVRHVQYCQVRDDVGGVWRVHQRKIPEGGVQFPRRCTDFHVTSLTLKGLEFLIPQSNQGTNLWCWLDRAITRGTHCKVHF